MLTGFQPDSGKVVHVVVVERGHDLGFRVLQLHHHAGDGPEIFTRKYLCAKESVLADPQRLRPDHHRGDSVGRLR